MCIPAASHLPLPIHVSARSIHGRSHENVLLNSVQEAAVLLLRGLLLTAVLLTALAIHEAHIYGAKRSLPF